jgi:ferredoxin
VRRASVDENTCDNCEQYCLFGHQVKVETVDGAKFMCPECAPEFQEDDDE